MAVLAHSSILLWKAHRREGESCIENSRRQTQTFALSMPLQEEGFEVSQKTQVANHLSPVLSEACALAIGTSQLCVPTVPCREVSCDSHWSSSSLGGGRREQACWITTRNVCSARVQSLWPAAFWLAPPVFLPGFFLPSAELMERRLRLLSVPAAFLSG